MTDGLQILIDGGGTKPYGWHRQFGWDDTNPDLFVYAKDGRRRTRTWAALGFVDLGSLQLSWVTPPSWALVRGRHYAEWVEPIKQMKRDGAHAEAVHLLWECQAATMRSDQGCPAPWYFEQEAITCRKDKHFDAELAVLQRYLDACSGPPHPKMVERMAGAQALATRRLRGTGRGKQLQAEADAIGEGNQDSGEIELARMITGAVRG